MSHFVPPVINAENAAHKSEKFRTMAQRTRQEYLKDLATNFSSNNTLDSGSKLSKSAQAVAKEQHLPLPWRGQALFVDTRLFLFCLLLN